MEKFDDLTGLEELKGYDSFLCCLGSRVKNGAEIFIKVDKTYPENFAKLAKQLEVPYFGLLSSTGASAGSWFLYMRTKGEAENSLKEIGVKNLAIFRPGLLRNRDGDVRYIEKIVQFTNLGT
jgi:oxidoreductase